MLKPDESYLSTVPQNLKKISSYITEVQDQL